MGSWYLLVHPSKHDMLNLASGVVNPKKLLNILDLSFWVSFIRADYMSTTWSVFSSVVWSNLSLTTLHNDPMTKGYCCLVKSQVNNTS